MKDGHWEEYHDVVDQRFLGEERFFEKLKAQPEEELETSRCKKPVSAAFRDVARALEIEPSVLSGAECGWETSRARALDR